MSDKAGIFSMTDERLSWSEKVNKDCKEKNCVIDISERDHVFITSDTHFNQKRTYKLSKRDLVFNSTTHMDRVMRENILNKVRLYPDSVFIHLGDRGNDVDAQDAKSICTVMKEINKEASRSYLIMGNYEAEEMHNLGMSFDEYRDRLMETELWTDVFEHIAFIKSPIEVQCKSGKKFKPLIMLVHRPVDYKLLKHTVLDISDDKRDEMFAFFGHIHGRQMIKKFGLEVGVDCHNFKPLSFEDCMFFINALTMGYYDENVWC